MLLSFGMVLDMLADKLGEIWLNGLGLPQRGGNRRHLVTESGSRDLQ